jgi:hypothetical protein
MQTHNPASFDAFVQLLARPDPRDLPRRTHVCRCEGDPDRRVTRFPAILMRWLQRHYLEVDVEEPVASPTRTVTLPRRSTNPGLRLLRPTGTGYSAFHDHVVRAFRLARHGEPAAFASEGHGGKPRRSLWRRPEGSARHASEERASAQG